MVTLYNGLKCGNKAKRNKQEYNQRGQASKCLVYSECIDSTRMLGPGWGKVEPEGGPFVQQVADIGGRKGVGAVADT